MVHAAYSAGFLEIYLVGVSCMHAQFIVSKYESDRMMLDEVFGLESILTNSNEHPYLR